MTVAKLKNEDIKEAKEIFLRTCLKLKGKDERKSMTISELSRELYKLQCQENLHKLLGI